MEKLKVIHVVEDLHVGGVERVVEILAHATKAKYGLQVWCVFEGGSIAERLKNSGVEVKVFGIRSCYDIFRLSRLAQLLKKEKIDVLHCHGYFGSTAGRIAGILARTKCMVNHVHTTFHNLSWFNVWIDRCLNRFVKYIVFISEEIESTFLKAGYQKSNKHVIVYNGIDSINWVKRNFNNPAKTIICVASLYEHKGHRYLLNAFKRVVAQFKDVKLQIVGKGKLSNDLNRQVSKLGISAHVEFLGERTDVVHLLANAHIFVLPSLREGIPLSVIEAMASGLPIIASEVGGMKEMLTNQINGILCRPRNVDDFESALNVLLSVPEKAEALGQKAREVYENKFTSKLMVDHFDQLYTQGVS